MRRWLYIMPIFVLARALFAAELDPCELRLALPVQVLSQIVERGLERKIVSPEQVAQSFAEGRWENPFARAASQLTAGQYVELFKLWENRLTPAMREQFRQELGRKLAKLQALGEVSEAAQRATEDVLAPRIFMELEPRRFKGRGNYVAGTFQGRPVFTNHVYNSSVAHFEVILDPFNPRAEDRIRYFDSVPLANSDSVDGILFEWQERTYLVRPSEGVIFDVQTGQEVGQKYDFAKRVKPRVGRDGMSDGKYPKSAHVVITPEGPRLIAVFMNRAESNLLSIPLFSKGARHEMFGGEVEKATSVKRVVSEGREFLVAYSSRKLWIWERNKTSLLATYDLAERGYFENDASALFRWEGRFVLAAAAKIGGAREILLIDAETGKDIKSLGKSNSVELFAFDGPKEAKVVAGFDVTSWTVIDAATGVSHNRIASPYPYSKLKVFRLNGRMHAIVGHWAGSFEVLDLDNEGQPVRVEAGTTRVDDLEVFAYGGHSYAFLGFHEDNPVVVKLLEKSR